MIVALEFLPSIILSISSHLSFSFWINLFVTFSSTHSCIYPCSYSYSYSSPPHLTSDCHFHFYLHFPFFFPSHLTHPTPPPPPVTLILITFFSFIRYVPSLTHSLPCFRVDEDSQGEALGALNGIKVRHYTNMHKHTQRITYHIYTHT